MLSVLIEDVYLLGLVRRALWPMVGFGAGSAEDGGGEGKEGA